MARAMRGHINGLSRLEMIMSNRHTVTSLKRCWSSHKRFEPEKTTHKGAAFASPFYFPCPLLPNDLHQPAHLQLSTQAPASSSSLTWRDPHRTALPACCRERRASDRTAPCNDGQLHQIPYVHSCLSPAPAHPLECWRGALRLWHHSSMHSGSSDSRRWRASDRTRKDPSVLETPPYAWRTANIGNPCRHRTARRHLRLQFRQIKRQRRRLFAFDCGKCSDLANLTCVDPRNNRFSDTQIDDAPFSVYPLHRRAFYMGGPRQHAAVQQHYLGHIIGERFEILNVQFTLDDQSKRGRLHTANRECSVQTRCNPAAHPSRSVHANQPICFGSCLARRAAMDEFRFSILTPIRRIECRPQ